MTDQDDHLAELKSQLTTEIKRREALERRLHASEQRFDSLMDNLRNIIFLHGVKGTDKHGYTEEGAFIYGRDAQTIAGTVVADKAAIDVWYASILPQDRPAYLAAERRRKETGEDYLLDYRIRHPVTGQIRWMRECGWVVNESDSDEIYFDGYIVDISDQKEIELALRVSEERFRGVFEHGAVGAAILNLEGVFQRVNPAYCNYLGYSEDALLGRHFSFIIHPDDLGAVSQRLTRLVAGELEHYQHERRYRHKDGQILWGLANLSLQRDAGGHPQSFIVQVQNITQGKHAEQALRDSEERFRSLAEGSIQGIFVHRDWRLLFANQALASMLGYSCAEDVIALGSPEAFIAPHELKRLQHNYQARLRGEPLPAVYEYEAYLRDGSLAVWENRSSLVNWEGQQAVQTTVVDVTERRRAYKKLEQRVEARTQELTRANTKLKSEIQQRKNTEALLEKERALLAQRVDERTLSLQQTNLELIAAARAKDEFLGTMSHELRTPLNAIMGLSEVLLDSSFGPLTEQQNDYLRMIYTNGQHLLSLISDILDMTRLNATALQLNISDIAIAALCESCLLVIQPIADKKNQTLRLKIDDYVSTIAADERRLKQILINLLSNAVKFTPVGGRIELAVSTDCQTAITHFMVSDNGIGIAPEDLPRLFKPFVQLDSGLNRSQEGTGLGLALVAKMIDLHGGSISVDSIPQQGSRFTVALPTFQNAAATLRAVAVPVVNQTATTKPAASELILIAEDNDSNLLMLSAYLEAQGYRIESARNGSDALQQARKKQPHLILMDVQMPVMDGLEAIRQLRTDPAFIKTPIIALTALTMAGDRERCLSAGANHYFSKPVKMQALLSAIQHLLGSA